MILKQLKFLAGVGRKWVGYSGVLSGLLSALLLTACAQHEDPVSEVADGELASHGEKLDKSAVAGNMAHAPVVESAWVRLLPPTVRSTALYFTVKNESASSMRIDRLTLDWASHVEFHETLERDGMMHMVPLEDTQLAPGQSMEFKPGGKHVMVMGLREPLQAGAQLSATLHYSIVGSAAVTSSIENKPTEVSAIEISADPSETGLISFSATVKQDG